MIIAIDGPSGSGKGSLSQKLACHFNIPHMDTGRYFRKLACVVDEAGSKVDDVETILSYAHKIENNIGPDPVFYTEHTGELASKLAAALKIREAFSNWVLSFLKKNKSAILDGRDVGTILCPDADVKIFLTADLKARALRREKEYGIQSPELTQKMLERDERDTNRKDGPLVQALDAHIIDSTHLTEDEVFLKALAFVEKTISEKSLTI